MRWWCWTSASPPSATRGTSRAAEISPTGSSASGQRISRAGSRSSRSVPAAREREWPPACWPRRESTRGRSYTAAFPTGTATPSASGAAGLSEERLRVSEVGRGPYLLEELDRSREIGVEAILCGEQPRLGLERFGTDLSEDRRRPQRFAACKSNSPLLPGRVRRHPLREGFELPAPSEPSHGDGEQREPIVGDRQRFVKGVRHELVRERLGAVVSHRPKRIHAKRPQRDDDLRVADNLGAFQAARALFERAGVVAASQEDASTLPPPVGVEVMTVLGSRLVDPAIRDRQCLFPAPGVVEQPNLLAVDPAKPVGACETLPGLPHPLRRLGSFRKVSEVVVGIREVVVRALGIGRVQLFEQPDALSEEV